MPVTGRTRGDQPDVAHPLWGIEVKERQALPQWLLEAMQQARAAARGGQVAVVVLHQAGQRHSDDLAILRLADFVDLYGTLEQHDA